MRISKYYSSTMCAVVARMAKNYNILVLPLPFRTIMS